MDYIKSLCEKVYKIWSDRGTLRAEAARGAGYVRENRHVYYDTDGIMEQQVETVRVCEECSGLSVIESQADTGRRVTAIILPNNACPDCTREGYELFEKSGERGMKVLQDKKKDVYLQKYEQ